MGGFKPSFFPTVIIIIIIIRKEFFQHVGITLTLDLKIWNKNPVRLLDWFQPAGANYVCCVALNVTDRQTVATAQSALSNLQKQRLENKIKNSDNGPREGMAT